MDGSPERLCVPPSDVCTARQDQDSLKVRTQNAAHVVTSEETGLNLDARLSLDGIRAALPAIAETPLPQALCRCVRLVGDVYACKQAATRAFQPNRTLSRATREHT